MNLRNQKETLFSFFDKIPSALLETSWNEITNLV